MVKLWRLVLYEPEGQSNRRIIKRQLGSADTLWGGYAGKFEVLVARYTVNQLMTAVALLSLCHGCFQLLQ